MQIKIVSHLLSLLIFVSVNSYAIDTKMTIINHFNQTLHVQVGINPDVLPNFPEKFDLAVGAQKSSTVRDTGKEAYLPISTDNPEQSAFFGVEVLDNKTKFYGYVSKGIAFSWDNETIIFCTPEEYQKKNHC